MAKILRNCRSWVYGPHRNAALRTWSESVNRSLDINPSKSVISAPKQWA